MATNRMDMCNLLELIQYTDGAYSNPQTRIYMCDDTGNELIWEGELIEFPYWIADSIVRNCGFNLVSELIVYVEVNDRIRHMHAMLHH